MNSGQPEEPEEDGARNEILRAVDTPLAATARAGEPVDGPPLAAADQASPIPEAPEAGPDDTEVELDRIARYLRGPTAFTA